MTLLALSSLSRSWWEDPTILLNTPLPHVRPTSSSMVRKAPRIASAWVSYVRPLRTSAGPPASGTLVAGWRFWGAAKSFPIVPSFANPSAPFAGPVGPCQRSRSINASTPLCPDATQPSFMVRRVFPDDVAPGGAPHLPLLAMPGHVAAPGIGGCPGSARKASDATRGVGAYERHLATSRQSQSVRRVPGSQGH